MRAGIRSRPWAGLDIGSYSIKLLAVQGGVGGSRYWLSETPLPRPEGEPDRLHAKDVVARAIADCLSNAGLSPRSFHGVSLGISGSDVIVKQISLPLLADEEVGSALRFEARKHLPFDPQGMVIDYQILGRYPSEKRLDVLLAAVSQEHADRELAPLRMLGMDADILDAAPLALTNALVHNAPLDREAYLLLDIGHSSSHLTLFQRGEPYFTRRLDFGGKSLTQAIADGVRVPLDEAEEWKLAAGSDEPGFRVDWTSPEMSAMLNGLRHHLVEELRRSLAFYRTVGNLPESLKLWISGGSARLPGLAAQLSELLGYPVLLFNPIESLAGAPHGGGRPRVGPQFAQAFGLALRAA
jgi:type IV pilus assembly protein PilM